MPSSVSESLSGQTKSRIEAIASSPCVHLSNCTPVLTVSPFRLPKLIAFLQGTASLSRTTRHPTHSSLSSPTYTRGTPSSHIMRNYGCVRTAPSPPVLGSSKNSSTISLMTQPVSPSVRAALLTLLLAVSPPMLSCRSVIGCQTIGGNTFVVIPSLCMPYIFPNHILLFLNLSYYFYYAFFPFVSIFSLIISLHFL